MKTITSTMSIEKIIEEARAQKFGPKAIQILRGAAVTPTNPFDFFGRELRRGWSYAYFERLHRAGFLRRVNTPVGRHGYHWYRTVCGGVGMGL